jgi:hypothetical protein
LVFTVVFLAIALAPLWKGGNIRWWSVGITLVFLLAALTRPKVLAPLNRLWFKVAMLLARMTNPVTMGIIFFLVITPAALVMRLMGKDPLRRKFDPAAPSYWIERKPPGPAPETMTNQF